MEGKRFDELTRLVGGGASRRSILRGLLGLGGVVAAGTVAGSNVEARILSTRPRITTAPPPSCLHPNQLCGGTCCEPGKCQDGHCCPNTTDVWCGPDECCDAGLCAGGSTCCEPDEKVCGAACCPATAACARSGNTDICCDPAEGGVPCGRDCCADPNQCCDGECCPAGMTCLTRVFAEGPFVEEETCCPTEQTCDNRCCDGVCFDPGTALDGDETIPGGLDQFEQTCCPAGGSLCTGETGTTCCSGPTPDCCVRWNDDTFEFEPLCIDRETQCCEDDECRHVAAPEECREGECSRQTQQCVLGQPCGGYDNEVCCGGADGICCWIGTGCCGTSCCDVGFECCERAVEGELTFTCINRFTGDCCEDSDCDNGCQICEATVCVPACEDDACCMAATDPAEWACLEAGQCCNAQDCASLNPGTDARCWLCRTDQDFACAPVPEGDNCRGEGPAGVCCAGTCITGRRTCPPDCPEGQAPCGNACCVQCENEEDCAEAGLDPGCVDCLSGVCTTVADLGDRCIIGADEGDEFDGYCAEDGTCLPCLTLNEPCTAHAQCCTGDESALYCDAGSATCQPCLEAGETCTDSAQCCIDGRCADSVCVFCGLAEDPCASDNECCQRHFCDFDASPGVCQSCGNERASCSRDHQCCGPMICFAGICSDCQDSGQSCLEDSDCCEARFCNDDGKCELCHFEDTACSEDRECCGAATCQDGFCSSVTATTTAAPAPTTTSGEPAPTSTTGEPAVTTTAAPDTTTSADPGAQTTTPSPPATTTTAPPVTTAMPATTTPEPECSTDNDCGTARFCHQGACIFDQCVIGQCENPCAICTDRVTGTCVAQTCGDDPCLRCIGLSNGMPVCEAINSFCCPTNSCPVNCRCDDATETCLCPQNP